MSSQDPLVFKKVAVKIPFGIGSLEWEVNPIQRKAAWSLYIELVTRISVEPLKKEEGILREALNSLYNLFPITREILKESGPDVGALRESVGGIAIAVLNNGIRPFLSKWHPQLQDWEIHRSQNINISIQNHEKAWDKEPIIREELKLLQHDLKKYADALEIIIGI